MHFRCFEEKTKYFHFNSFARLFRKPAHTAEMKPINVSTLVILLICFGKHILAEPSTTKPDGHLSKYMHKNNISNSNYFQRYKFELNNL